MKKIIITSLILILSLPLFSQDELTVLDMFYQLPSEAFDGICDDLSTDEREEIIRNESSGIWTLKKESKSEYSIIGGDQSITVLKKDTEKFQMAIVHTSCAQTSRVSIWIFNKDEHSFIKKNLLPEVKISEFYSKEDAQKIPKDYKGSISFYLDEGRIIASLWTWMETPIENLQIKYKIYIDWKVDKFEKVKELYK